MLIAGIEEAGRGPVIGPMVMCGVLADEKDIQKLRSIGAKDSKLLTPETRELLYGQIVKMVKAYELIIVGPKEIDDALLSPTSNLNKLEAEKMAELINRLKPEKVILDCPSNNEKAYAAYVKSMVNDKKTVIIAEHKADVTYPVVSAASILAKVRRDREIQKLKDSYGTDFGSGYPSDELTQHFLEKNYDKYPFFRKTWASYQNVLARKKQKTLGEF